MTFRIALGALMLIAATAGADDDAVTGFEATGSGELSGRAVDANDHPLAQVEIHVVSKSGNEQIVKTDKDGNYKVELRGATNETSMIFVRGHRGSHLGGIVASSTVVDGTEAIEIHETARPAVPAKPVDGWIHILPYSKTASSDDEWVRAWMTLDVDETGTVRHLKWMKRPGHDLDAIAVREAFDVRFEPARDAAKRAVGSQILWMFEWPSHSWLIDHHHYDLTRMPADYIKVACQKAGEHRHDRRDCAQADLASSLGEAWMAKPPPPPATKR
jgi:hypothetical protein